MNSTGDVDKEKNQSQRSLGEQGQFVIDSLEKYGIKINDNWWPIKMFNRLKKQKGPITPGNPDFKKAAESIRTFYLFEFILTQGEGNAIKGQFMEKLKQAVRKGTELPEHDADKSTGRDTQFELFYTSIYKHVL